MKSYRNNYSLLLIIGLLVLFGCNWSDREANNDQKPKGDNEKVATNPEVTPDEDFEIKTDDETFETPEKDEEEDDGKEVQPNKPKVTVVKFGKGKTTRTYDNAVISAESHTYILGASKGQKTSVKISSHEDNAVFSVRSPSGGSLVSGTKSWTGNLPANGKYKITVTPTRGNANYKISFYVQSKPKPTPGSGGITTVVKFRKGGTSAVYKNAVIRAERNTYILGAGSGQFMSVSIGSLEGNAVFSVVAPNGRILVRSSKGWRGQLPVKGKYRIAVTSTRGNATYTIRFSVR